MNKKSSEAIHQINNPLTIVLGQANRIKLAAHKNRLNAQEVLQAAEQIESMALKISEILQELKESSAD